MYYYILRMNFLLKYPGLKATKCKYKEWKMSVKHYTTYLVGLKVNSMAEMWYKLIICTKFHTRNSEGTAVQNTTALVLRPGKKVKILLASPCFLQSFSLFREETGTFLGTIFQSLHCSFHKIVCKFLCSCPPPIYKQMDAEVLSKMNSVNRFSKTNHRLITSTNLPI